MQLHDGLDDSEAEAGSAGFAAARLVHPVEALENPLDMPGGNAAAVVDDRQHRFVALAEQLDADFALLAAVLDRVVDQIDDRLFNQLRVDADLGIVLDFSHQPDSGLFGARLLVLDRRQQRQREPAVDRLVAFAEGAAIKLRQA